MAFFTVFAGGPADTAVRFAEASDFDRLVIIPTSPGDTKFAFTEADASDIDLSVTLGTVPPGGFRFVLPAGEELWAYHPTNSFSVEVMVTKTEGDG